MWSASTFFNNIQPQKVKNRQGAGKDRTEIIKSGNAPDVRELPPFIL